MRAWFSMAALTLGVGFSIHCASSGDGTNEPEEGPGGSTNVGGSGAADGEPGRRTTREASLCDTVVCTDDGNDCTEDVCDEATGECGLVLDGAPCDDGLYCNGIDTCDGALCAIHAGNPCAPSEECLEDDAVCTCSSTQSCPGSDLGDGRWGEVRPWTRCAYPSTCTERGERSQETIFYECVTNLCESSSEVRKESCSRDTAGVSCADGSFCNGSERCAGGICQLGVPVTCEGAAPYCSNDEGRCVGCLRASHCDDGSYCTGSEQCRSGRWPLLQW